MSEQDQVHKPRLLIYYPDIFDVANWAKAHAKGLRPEQSHWGMHQAALHGFEVTGSRDRASRKRGWLGQLLFGPLRIDVDHLRVNKAAIDQADAIWTMSERDLLAIIGYFWLSRRPKSSWPVLVSDVCWLLDDWPDMTWLRRWIVRKLSVHATILLAVSPAVTEQLRRYLPAVRVETYRFGIPVQALAHDLVPGDRPGSVLPLQLLMPGNDFRRDWDLVVKAVDGLSDLHLTLLSKHAHVADHAAGYANVSFSQGHDYGDLIQHYRQCDAVVIASLPNQHGAGLTMMLEAAALAIPLIVIADPTLNAYLDERHVLIVAQGDVDGLKAAFAQLRQHPTEAAARAKAARNYVLAENMTSSAAVASRCALIHQALREQAGPSGE